MLIYLLRPLISLGADVMHGGYPPKAAVGGIADPSNITATLLGLISDERNAARVSETGEESAARRMPPGRLFNPSQWPECNLITPEDEAAWVNVCSIGRITPESAGLPPCEDESLWPPERTRSARFLATRALVHSFGRERTAAGFACPVPGNSARQVVPSAYVLIGGKLDGFTGLMPGMFEEFLQAVERRRPIFLLGGLGGAAEVLAQALLAPPSKRRARPSRFTKAYYVRSRENPNYRRMLDGLKELGKTCREPSIPRKADDVFDCLWAVLQHSGGNADALAALLGNGLTPAENRELLTTDGTTAAVHLIWNGLDRLLLGEPAGRGSFRRRPGRSAD